MKTKKQKNGVQVKFIVTITQRFSGSWAWRIKLPDGKMQGKAESRSDALQKAMTFLEALDASGIKL